MKTNYHEPKWANKKHHAYLKNAYYKGHNIQQERKRSIPDKKYIRAKRFGRNLPNAWNDIWPSRYKATSWKDKTKDKNQYG